jgi:hypothetical protein
VATERVGGGVGPRGLGRRILALVTLGCCALAGQGCRSTGQLNPVPFAAVEIPGNTPGQVAEAATEVFREHGYQLAEPGRTNLVFEKKAGGWNNLAYGSWLGDTPIWVRVKVRIFPLVGPGCELECRAFLVNEKDSATEEERPVSRRHRSQYQQLLEEIAKRFRRAVSPAERQRLAQNSARG